MDQTPDGLAARKSKMNLPVIRMGLLGLSIMALLVGVIAGFGAVLFRALIAFIHNLFFLGTFSINFDANQFTPMGPWGARRHPGAGDRRPDRHLPGR